MDAFLIGQTNLFTPQWTIWDIRGLELCIQLFHICLLLTIYDSIKINNRSLVLLQIFLSETQQWMEN